MAYKVIETPFGKSVIKHRYAADEMHRRVSQHKDRSGQPHVHFQDGHIERVFAKRCNGKSERPEFIRDWRKVNQTLIA